MQISLSPNTDDSLVVFSPQQALYVRNTWEEFFFVLSEQHPVQPSSGPRVEILPSYKYYYWLHPYNSIIIKDGICSNISIKGHNPNLCFLYLTW